VSEEHLVTGGVELEPVGNGVARISWSPQLQEQGVQAASIAVREQMRVAFEELKQSRVEAFVAPDDEEGARIATWSGLQREGVRRGAVESDHGRIDRVVFARLDTDVPVSKGRGFRALLNSFLPRKRAISQVLVRDLEGRVLLCNLTYKQDWDLPGGVVEVNESPRLAAFRELEEELGLGLPPGRLVLTDWLPPWSGWDDAVCLVFDGGTHDAELASRVVPQAREIRQARFCTMTEVHHLCADFTARRIDSVIASLDAGAAPSYTESGRPL
jgi:8-oxo-dGTP pyrophosphatase MutT (NUDIX family)